MRVVVHVVSNKTLNCPWRFSGVNSGEVSEFWRVCACFIVLTSFHYGWARLHGAGRRLQVRPVLDGTQNCIFLLAGHIPGSWTRGGRRECLQVPNFQRQSCAWGSWHILGIKGTNQIPQISPLPQLFHCFQSAIFGVAIPNKRVAGKVEFELCGFDQALLLR